MAAVMITDGAASSGVVTGVITLTSGLQRCSRLQSSRRKTMGPFGCAGSTSCAISTRCVCVCVYTTFGADSFETFFQSIVSSIPRLSWQTFVFPRSGDFNKRDAFAFAGGAVQSVAAFDRPLQRGRCASTQPDDECTPLIY